MPTLRPLLLLLALLIAAPAAAQDAWVADEGLSSKLAKGVLLGDVILRPPKGYELQSDSKDEAGVRYSTVAWTGPRRPDLTAAVFQVSVVAPVTPEPGPSRAPTWAELENVVLSLLEGDERLHTGFQRGKLERGTVNGIRAVRARWDGIQKQSGMRIVGFAYVMDHGGMLFMLSGRDAKEHATGSNAIGEAAALSLRPDKPSK